MRSYFLHIACLTCFLYLHLVWSFVYPTTQKTLEIFIQKKINMKIGAKKHHDNEMKENLSSSSVINRRSALITSTRQLMLLPTTLSSVFFLPSSAKANQEQQQQIDYEVNRPRTILITGCNSGVGFNAALRMAQYPCKHTIILACRTLAKAQDAIQRIYEHSPTSSIQGKLIPIECDLANLNSIQSCIDTISSHKVNIDVLCLNAAIARNTNAKDVLRTQQGFELTIGTNHIGHFYLTQGLLPLVQERIVVTASGVHDPESPGGAQGSKASLGTLQGMMDQGIQFEMIDGGQFDPDKAYKDSKLCNVLFTRELQKRLYAQNSSIKVNCFNPGLIVSTGLFRDQNPVFSKLFDVAATDIFKVGETVDWGGALLEYMSLDKMVGTSGGQYYSSPPGSSKFGVDALDRVFVQTQVSLEARDEIKASKLWDLSEQLIHKV